MKKQLGLLTLGMAVLLVAPVVGQAGATDPEISQAIVKVEPNKKGTVDLVASPDINFETITSSDDGSSVDAKPAGLLTVRDGNEDATWTVDLTVGDFINDDNKTLKNPSFKLEAGEVHAESEHNDDPQKGIVARGYGEGNGDLRNAPLAQREKGTTGTFSHEFNNANITIKPWAPTGTYEAKMNWKLTTTVQ